MVCCELGSKNLILVPMFASCNQINKFWSITA
uniref:Uncharacterized protein n=1 Tax=Setaria italica TaxID=4555 RepID=K4APG0_SETIT